MAIVDIIGGVCGGFTVDLSVDEVPVVGAAGILQTVNGNSVLQEADNCKLTAMWVVLPYCFGTGTIPQRIYIQGQETGGGPTFAIPEVGSDNAYHVPVENVETPIQVFIPWGVSPNTTTWEFQVMVSGGRISMFNVPAGLDQEEIDVYAFLRLEHNFQLS